MIRIERGSEVSPGIWAYTIPSLGLGGRSRQPLLDACRQIERAGGDPRSSAGVFREGRSEPDISCLVGNGAKVTVSEADNGTIKFVKFREFQGVRT